jgi:Tol biopolymer transport system component
MTSNLKRSVDTPRRIARILCRALMCVAALALAATEANAQTTPMAYRWDYYYLWDCPAGCIIAFDSYGFTPWATFGGVQPTWSPSGARVAFTNGYNIFVIPSTGGTAIQLTNNTSDAFILGPAWSPDGGQIAFVRQTSGPAELDLMNADGSGVRALSNRAASGNDVLWNVAHPSWSPDGARIAFTCEIDNQGICVINRDGTGLVRLTNGGWSPVWSPDGTRIAFSSGNGLALMNVDGSGVSPIGTSIPGWPGSWSPDGAQIAFTALGDLQQLCGSPPPGGTDPVCVTYTPLAIYTATTDGAVVTRVVDSGGDPAFMPACTTCIPNTIPITIDTNPAGLQITIDSVTSVAPQFFDWVPGSSHTIATNSPEGAGGTRNIFASWSDAGAISHSVAPTAATTFTANFKTQYLLTTGVSPGASGSITASPSSGDGFYDSGASVQLTATPIAGFTFAGFSGALAGVTNPQFVLMNAPKTVIANFSSTMHIGDLDGTRTNQQNAWTAAVTITLHDSKHGPVANATVSGSWSIGGTASCTTDSTGQCFVSKSATPRNTKSVVFTIVNVTNSTFLYRSADNHDPDGDSNGTSVTVSNP